MTVPFGFRLGPAGLLELRGPRAWRDFARTVESMGYDAMCLGDHGDERPDPTGLAVAVACWTTSLRVAAHVYCNDFRHPALLVKEVNSAAMLTDGRFDCGIGAGWRREDYGQRGAELGSPRDRIARLEETIAILRRSWSDDTVTFRGEHYVVEGLPGAVVLGGVRRPSLVVGGGGPRMLRLAAREADVVSVNARLTAGVMQASIADSATAAAATSKVDVVRGAAGDRLPTPILEVVVHYVEVTSERAGALRRAAAATGMTEDEAVASPHVLVGDVDEVESALLERRERYGFSRICTSAAAVDELAPVVERLAGR